MRTSENEDRPPEPLTLAIAKAIADVKGIEHQQLELVLRKHIDIDAIESLYEHDSSSWTLSFEIPEHTITVLDNGTVFVDGTEKRAEI